MMATDLGISTADDCRHVGNGHADNGHRADYGEFLRRRSQSNAGSGFEPNWLSPALFDFQSYLADHAIRMGRSAIFANPGMGKTIVQLTWAENIVRHTNRPVLILTPLAVGPQTIREAAKFGMDAVRSHDGKFPPGARIIVTNYEQLGKFNRQDFSGCVCDESGILKNFDGVRRAEVTEFMRELPYRLLCTATPAPNDYVELGTSSEALGEMGFQDMVTRFFRKETQKDYLGWGRTKYRMRGHAERDFWRWVCSWARACRRPSDLGDFDDSRFVLPELVIREHPVESRRTRDGFLFDLPAETLQDQREEQRRTLTERCEKVAELVARHDGRSIAWCVLNDEGDLIERLVPGSVQVSGSDPDRKKEEAIEWFVGEGSAKKVLVSKAEIFGYGLNLQCCHHMTFFPSNSWERYYQAVCRCQRFGQEHAVLVDVVTTDGSRKVVANLRRKAEQAEAMFSKLVALMDESLRIDGTPYGGKGMEVPAWLRGGATR